MPRSGLRESTISEENRKPTKVKLQQECINHYFKAVDEQLKPIDDQIVEEVNFMMLKFNTAINELLIKIPGNHMATTIQELKVIHSKAMAISDTTAIKSFNMASFGDIISSTRATRILSNTNAPRHEALFLKPKQLSIIKKAKDSRHNLNAISKNKLRLAAHSTLNLLCMNSPINQNIQGVYIKTISPKIKANTSQIILRRPRLGELAVSMQGSPLMVSGVTNEKVANVNIPLTDGRIFSIQPRHGLCPLKLSKLDKEMQDQVEALRVNLIKVCKTYSHPYIILYLGFNIIDDFLSKYNRGR